MIELEDAVMEIIVNAGQSRSLCFEALHAARTGNIDEARLLLNEADGYARRAHQMQTQLIEQDAGGLFEGALDSQRCQFYRAFIGPGQIAGADQQHQRGVGYIHEKQLPREK